MLKKLQKEAQEEFDNLQKNRTVPMSRKEAHDFIDQQIQKVYNKVYNNAVDEIMSDWKRER